MRNEDSKLKDQILNIVEESRMKLDNKLKLMWLMDKAFRNSLGPIYVTDRELDDRDLLHRSM